MQYKKMQTILFDGTKIDDVNSKDVLLLGLNFTGVGLMGKLMKLQNIDKSIGSIVALDFGDLKEDEANIIFDPDSQIYKRLDGIIKEYLKTGVVAIFIPSAHLLYPSENFKKCIYFLKNIIDFLSIRSITSPVIFGSDAVVDLSKFFGENAKYAILNPRHGIHEFCADLFLFLPKYQEVIEENKAV